VENLAGLAAGMLGQGAGLGLLEQAMRAALAAAGARLLEAVLAGEDGYAGPRAKCASGHQAVYAGRRAKTITTVLGPVRVARAWYHCPECNRGFAPSDERLGTAGTSLSPGLAEMIARVGAEVPFGKAPRCWPTWPGSPSAQGRSSGPPRLPVPPLAPRPARRPPRSAPA
jgi:hypothetical protein